MDHLIRQLIERIELTEEQAKEATAGAVATTTAAINVTVLPGAH